MNIINSFILKLTIIEIDKKNIVFDPEVQTYCINPGFKCPNYGHSWACPPEAPYLDKILREYVKFFLIYEKFDIKEYIREKRKKFPKRDEKKLRNAFYRDNFMRNSIEENVNAFINKYDEKYNEILVLWDGHCRVCEKNKEKCTYDSGSECRYPNEIRYSMEAVGINVTETVKNLNLDIEWPPKHYAYRFSLVCLK